MKASEWKSRVASLGCIVCSLEGNEEVPANLHHVREGQGMSQRASDFLIIPLCRKHHQEKGGIHDKQAFYLKYKMDELDLLALVLESL